MNSPEIKAFIRKHSTLFWYISEDKKEKEIKQFLVDKALDISL
jgi:hypothetical protein